MDYEVFLKEVARREGGKKSLDIAQIKEVVKHTKNIVKERTGIDIYNIIKTVNFDYVEKPVKKKGKKK